MPSPRRLVVAVAFFLCTAAESAVAEGRRERIASMTHYASASWTDGPITAAIGRLFSAITHPVILLVASFLVLGLFLVENRRWESAPSAPSCAWWTFPLYFVRFHVCLGVVSIAAIVLAVSFCLVFFPSLVEQGHRPRSSRGRRGS